MTVSKPRIRLISVISGFHHPSSFTLCCASHIAFNESASADHKASALRGSQLPSAPHPSCTGLETARGPVRRYTTRPRLPSPPQQLFHLPTQLSLVCWSILTGFRRRHSRTCSVNESLLCGEFAFLNWNMVIARKYMRAGGGNTAQLG